ncbi:hypothetical protein DFH06DRAFT_1464850 [Mycena polygramma]|nr:hypothetical protein DFH06DRAFT_1464850 [Mycena polygramma]
MHLPGPVRSNLEVVKTQIEAMESNIAHLTSQIRQLALSLQKERTRLAQLWFGITPIGRVPNEILAEIFMHSVLSESPVDSVLPRPRTRQAVLLSHVCPSWRQVVNCTARLWSAGVVDVRLARKNTTAQYLSGLKTLLQRSDPLPVSVSIAEDVGELSAFPEALAHLTKSVFQVMAPTTNRWKSLKVDSFSSRLLAELPQGSFPALESLDMQHETYAHNPIRTFFPAPQLRRLALRIYGDSSGLLLVPWVQLTHLELGYSSLSGCRAILLRCSRLVSAEFMTSEWNSDHPTNAPPTVLPCLEILRVRFDSGGDTVGHVEPFFEPLILPALHTLDLVFDPSPGVVWSTDKFSVFQLRSPCISHIRLTNCPLKSTELITVLRLAPAVTELKLRYCMDCIDDEFLRVFANGGDDTCTLAPRLRQLDWYGVGYAFSDESFEAAIRSRWWVADEERNFVRLEKVSVSRYTEDSMDEDLIERMRDIMDQGLDLTFPED